MTHSNYSLKKLGITFKLQKELLKIEMNHDEIDYSNYKDQKMNGWVMLKEMYCVQLFHMLDIVKQWKSLLDFQGGSLFQRLD